MRGPVLVALAGLAVAGCGSGRSSTPPVENKRDGGVTDASVAIEIPARPLGLADVTAFQWRKRAGQAAFREARTHEQAGDWAAVVSACQQALAADPSHLEAAWLLAVGFAKTDQPTKILAPLHHAAAGDFGKWGHASLELPSLQPWLATPQGQAWRRRVEADRALFLSAIARAVVVTTGGDLYGYDLETSRYYRLTRTHGALFAALRPSAGDHLVYLTRQRVKGKPSPQLAVGMVDFARGRTSRPIPVGSSGPALITYASNPEPAAWIGTGRPKDVAWRRMNVDGKLTPLPPKTKQPSGRYLMVFARTARLHATPIPDVAADWDQAGLASAIRIGKSARVISVPSPALIDGNTLSWSPGRTHLAFVAQLDERCPDSAPPTTPSDAPPAVIPRTAVYVADAATGSLQELVRGAEGLVVQWITDRKLAIAGDDGVTLVDLDGTPPVKLAGTSGLVDPRRTPRCTPDPGDEVPLEEPDPAGDTAGDGKDSTLVEPMDRSPPKVPKN